jgi:GH35 family endo-1,4-beta-xylanase
MAKGRWFKTSTLKEMDDHQDLFSLEANKTIDRKAFIFSEKKSAIPLNKGQLGIFHCWIKVDSEGPTHFNLEIKQKDIKRGRSLSPLSKVISPQNKDWLEVSIPFKTEISTGASETQFYMSTRDPFEHMLITRPKILLAKEGVALSELPSTHSVAYLGREKDASWREQAAQRIKKHRMAKIKLKILIDGKKAPGATLSLQQKRHHFQHGSAVNYRIITAKGEESEQYRHMAKELFNSSSAENAQKWRLLVMGREKSIKDKYQRMVDGNRWLHENGLPVRGHVLVWPGFKKLPEKYNKAHQEGTLDWDQLRKDIVDNIHHLGDLSREHTFEWDVLNEPYSNHDLTDHFGDSIMLDWFKEAEKAFPNQGLFLNDYGILRIGEYDLKHRAHFFKTVDYLASNSKMTGFAMQSHFKESSINTPEGIWEVMSELGKHNLDMRITEFDLDSLDEELVADYLEDILTLTFSHPKMLGFQTWGFWRKSMNVPTSALVDEQFNLTPAGKRYKELIFKKWWSKAQKQLNDESIVHLDVFYGKHLISVELNGKTLTKEVEVLPSDQSFEYTLEL